MNGKGKIIFQICIGSSLVCIGCIVWWWSMQLLWILIYPPPLVKQIIDSLPYIFWGLGVVLVIDGVRRKNKDS